MLSNDSERESLMKPICVILIVSVVVVLLFVVVEGRRLGVRRLWAPFVAMFTVGVSLALPPFLLLRQLRIEEGASNGLNDNPGKAL